MAAIDDTLKHVIEALNQAEARVDDAGEILEKLVDNTKDLVAGDAAPDLWYQLGWLSHSTGGLKYRIGMTRARAERRLARGSD